MNLKDKMDLRILAVNALYIYIDEFSLEDDDYIDYRAIRGKDRALNNRIKKMSEMTGVDEEKIYHIVINSIPTSIDKYFNELRDIGIPILTDEEIDAYEKSKYKEKNNG